MNKFIQFEFSDRRLINFLICLGFGGSLNVVLFPVLGTTAIWLSVVCSVIITPNPDTNLMKRVFGDKPGNVRNMWIFIIYPLVYTAILMLVFVFEIYEKNKEYYYIWVCVLSMIYFMSVFYLCLHLISKRNKSEDS